MHTYEVRPRKDKRGVDLISDALATLSFAGTGAITVRLKHLVSRQETHSL
jgi:hypothetical protein